MKLKKILWIVFVILAVIIGLYPLSYLLFDMSNGLLGIKNKELLANYLWNISFYTHISFGGIALLIGWTQFVKKFRAKKMRLHRTRQNLHFVHFIKWNYWPLYFISCIRRNSIKIGVCHVVHTLARHHNTGLYLNTKEKN